MAQPHSGKYVRLRELAAISLLAHPSIEKAAQSIGISEKCLRLWLEKPDMQERLRAVRQQVMDGSVARLTGLVGSAIETLERCLNSKRDGEAVKAARAILEHVNRLDRSQLQDRVEQLERQLAEMQRSRGGLIVNGVLATVSVSQEAASGFLEDLVRARQPATGIIEHQPAKTGEQT